AATICIHYYYYFSFFLLSEYNYEGEHADPKEFFECIDQLALAFSSRVSEYLMGDLDTNISLSSSMSSKTK
ncbi:hypothetical protein L9F63_025063, partial [Diploptera punctata]